VPVGHNSAVIFLGTAARASAFGAVIAASVLLSGCVSNVTGTAVRAQNAAPVDVPPLTEAKLADVLLSIGELNGIMGSTQMKVTSELQDMTDHSGEVSDPDCLGAIYGAEEPVYAGSGWTAMRDQVGGADGGALPVGGKGAEVLRQVEVVVGEMRGLLGLRGRPDGQLPVADRQRDV
jgi:outer membrane murein-binding lipoprotein Lpp